MKISIVVPTFNRRELVLRTVQTLIEQDFPPDQYEIIVVIDGSIDGSALALRALRAACPYQVFEQENRGLAAARNAGWRNAANEVVIFVDDDMVCSRCLVRAHADVHIVHTDVIGVGAVQLHSDSAKTVASECFNREVGAYALRGTRNLDPLSIADCIFGNTSLPTRWLEETGGFEESYRMREDAEFAVRLSRLGVRPVFVSEALAYEVYEKTPEDLIRDAEAFAESDLIFLQQYPEAEELTFAGRIAREWPWKRCARRLAASLPALSTFWAAPLQWLGNTFPENRRLLDLGVRALQVQRGIHYYRRLLKTQGRPAPRSGESK
jgi:glycosyltransferase involved in cell wall biosynthesis